MHPDDKAPEGPHGWIQWKGTGVCMDVYCDCGCHFHVDDEFMYYTRCPRCLKPYAVSGYVRLLPVTEAEARAHEGVLKTEEYDEERHGPREGFTA